jgi:hypothetical protein
MAATIIYEFDDEARFKSERADRDCQTEFLTFFNSSSSSTFGTTIGVPDSTTKNGFCLYLPSKRALSINPIARKVPDKTPADLGLFSPLAESLPRRIAELVLTYISIEPNSLSNEVRSALKQVWIKPMKDRLRVGGVFPIGV